MEIMQFKFVKRWMKVGYAMIIAITPSLFAAEFPSCPSSASQRNASCVHRVGNFTLFKNFGATSAIGESVSYSVKVVLARRLETPTSAKLYWMNHQKFSYHYDFVVRTIDASEQISTFNARNYNGTGAERSYFLGTVTLAKVQGRDVYLLELWNGDTMDAVHVREFLQRIKEAFSYEAPLYFHPMSIAQEEMAKEALDIPYLTDLQIFGGRTYQSLNEGEAYGYVTMIDAGQEQSTCLDASLIPVFRKVPNDMGVAAAVVTEEFQTPLSHINVKSMNRGTPNMSLKDAFTVFGPYAGMPIKLVVKGGEYRITLLAKETADAIIAAKNVRQGPPLSPKSVSESHFYNKLSRFRDLYPVIPTKAIHSQMIQTFGAKAANLALINRLVKPSVKQELNVMIPEGLAVPFSFYDQFMNERQAGLDTAQPERLASPKELAMELLATLPQGARASLCRAQPVLKRIRDIINRAKVPDQLRQLLLQEILEDAHSPIYQEKTARIRLRSSTNAEDLAGFNGAGLYESDGVNLHKPKNVWSRKATSEEIEKDLIKSIRKVYQSVFSDRAFAEREYYGVHGMAHFEVKMGLAIHDAFAEKTLSLDPGEQANGVALTIDPRTPREPFKVFINGQHYDLAVANPPSREECEAYGEDPTVAYATEELVVTTLTSSGESHPSAFEHWSFRRMSQSSIKRGEPVLIDSGDESVSPKEVRRLAAIMTIIRDGMARVYGQSATPDGFVLDAEWKIYGKDRTIIIKQGRPFVKPTLRP